MTLRLKEWRAVLMALRALGSAEKVRSGAVALKVSRFARDVQQEVVTAEKEKEKAARRHVDRFEEEKAALLSEHGLTASDDWPDDLRKRIERLGREAAEAGNGEAAEIDDAEIEIAVEPLSEQDIEAFEGIAGMPYGLHYLVDVGQK